jgi:hypothetical protein
MDTALRTMLADCESQLLVICFFTINQGPHCIQLWKDKIGNNRILNMSSTADRGCSYTVKVTFDVMRYIATEK